MKTLLFFISMLLLTGCTIEETYTFNEDFSGSYAIELSYEMYAMMDTTGASPVTEEVKSEIMGSLEGIKGISKVGVLDDMEKKSVKVTFDFNGLDALNKVFQDRAENETGSLGMPMGTRTISQKGKKIILRVVPVPMDEEAEDDMGINDMFEWHSTLIFPSKVKSVEGLFAKIGSNDNEVEIAYSLSDLGEIEEALEIIIKL